MLVENEIKEGLEKNKIVLGFNRVSKLLKLGKIKIIILSSSCSSEITKEIEYLSELGKIEVKKYEGNSINLGSLCKKPFKVSVLGILGNS